jgi:hypothetical protein
MRGSIIVIGVALVNGVAVASEGSYNFPHPCATSGGCGEVNEHTTADL